MRNVHKRVHKTNKRHNACTNRFANGVHEMSSQQYSFMPTSSCTVSSPSSPSYSLSSTSTYDSSFSFTSHSAASNTQMYNSQALLHDEVSEQYNLFKYLCQ